MARLSECDACAMGDHSRHYRVVEAVPEGMLGGAVCPCRGECVKRGPRPDPQMEMIADLLRSVEGSET